MDEPNTNRCPTHPESPKEFFCEICKAIYCNACYKRDKSHTSKISPLPSKKLLKSYEFIKFLGGGTFGKCFKVKSFADDQELALKIIYINEDNLFSNVKKEAQLLCSLIHKNLVRYTHSDRIIKENIFYILMELAEGCVQDKIKTMSQEDAFKYFKQIAEGLHYLHVEKDIIHRDLKPGNILLNGEECKICDLGVSKKMTQEYTKLSNTQGFGTVPYLPPEVFAGKEYSFKADIWALGIIFHKMLTNGDHPFLYKEKDLDSFKQRVQNHEIAISDTITNAVYLDLLKG